jgi:diacylglycerol kinase family enzyme
MGRIALLANPESGSGDADAVADELNGLGADVARFPIQDAEEALGSNAERIVVAGGDGSIGLAASIASREGVPLGVVPVGTANDFARAFELPDELGDAVRLAAEGSRTKRIELGRMRGEREDGERGRPFVNVASLGLPPAAARRASGLKKSLGPLAYAVGAVRAAASASPVRCRIADADGAELFAGKAWQATVACSGYFGGGSRVEADPSDGMLDALAVEAGSRVKLALRARGMRTGTLERQTGVHTRRSPSFVFDLDAETPFNVDGEICVRSGRVEFTVDPDAVEVVVG